MPIEFFDKLSFRVVNGFEDLCKIYAVENNKVTREANVFVYDEDSHSLIAVEYFNVETREVENENIGCFYNVDTARMYVQDFEA